MIRVSSIPFFRACFLVVFLITTLVTSAQAESSDSTEPAALPAVDAVSAPHPDSTAAQSNENESAGFDVRQARWGMTMDDVRGTEPKAPLEAADTARL